MATEQTHTSQRGLIKSLFTFRNIFKNSTFTMECCICMESISQQTNCITTPCGHSFHSNCMMTHTVYNGYKCPYCRTPLVDDDVLMKRAYDMSDDEDEDDEDDEDYDDYDEEEDSPEHDGEIETTNRRRRDIFHNLPMDSANDIIIVSQVNECEQLQNFRWFFQRVNGEELEGDEEEYNEQMREEDAIQELSNVMYDENKQQIERLVRAIKSTDSVSYDDLLTAFVSLNLKDYRYNMYASAYARHITSTIHSIDSRIRPSWDQPSDTHNTDNVA